MFVKNGKKKNLIKPFEMGKKREDFWEKLCYYDSAESRS